MVNQRGLVGVEAPMMFVSSRWMMLALIGALVLGCNEATGPLSLPAAVGRPIAASQGPRVGVIVAQGGGVTIVPSKGQAYAGGPDQQLLRDDSLVTAADSFVVVQLYNGHLVRLGANQRNVVEMLAPFHDPPADDDVEARFVRLLSSEERDDPALRGAITRVAGWNTRMSAAQTFAALPSRAAPVRTDEAPPAAPPPPPPPVAEASTPIGSTQEDSKRDTPLDGLGGGAAERAEKRSDTNQGRPAPKSDPVSPPKDQKASKKRQPTDGAPGGGSPPVQGPASRSPSDQEEAEESKSELESAPAPVPMPVPALPKQLRFMPAGGGKAQLLDLPTPLKGAAELATCAGAGAKITGRVKDHKLVALAVNGVVKCQALVGKASTLADGSFELTVTP